MDRARGPPPIGWRIYVAITVKWWVVVVCGVVGAGAVEAVPKLPAVAVVVRSTSGTLVGARPLLR